MQDLQYEQCLLVVVVVVVVGFLCVFLFVRFCEQNSAISTGNYKALAYICCKTGRELHTKFKIGRKY